MINLQEFENIKLKISDLKTEKDFKVKYLEQEKNKLINLNQELKWATEARIIIQQVALKTQQKLEQRFNQLITNALQIVFPDDNLEFKLTIVRRRNKTECDIDWYENGRLDGTVGGGVKDVSAFAARIAFWSLNKKARPIFFSDEPMKYLHSESYQENFSEMVKMLSTKLGLQHIIVSDQPGLYGDKKFIVEKGKVREIERRNYEN